jgi:hypothetical protein
MKNSIKPRRISISAVRRANDDLVRNSQTGKFLSENQSVGHIAIRVIYSGHNYEVEMTPEEIKEAYAQSVLATSNLAK